MNKLQAHFKRMQMQAANYIEPAQYVPFNGGPCQLDMNAAEEKTRFIGDMIHMLDGPEQRAAEAEQDQYVEDLRILVRSLMRDLRVVDHVVTLAPGTPEQRIIVASKLMEGPTP